MNRTASEVKVLVDGWLAADFPDVTTESEEGRAVLNILVPDEEERERVAARLCSRFRHLGEVRMVYGVHVRLVQKYPRYAVRLFRDGTLRSQILNIGEWDEAVDAAQAEVSKLCIRAGRRPADHDFRDGSFWLGDDAVFVTPYCNSDELHALVMEGVS